MLSDKAPGHGGSLDCVARVNRAIDHIVSNLAQPLRLESLAEVAGLSRFHFHRVFKSVCGETLNAFVKRQRLERALYLMSHAPRQSLTAVALQCGFASSSDFSRSFKQRYGKAPSRFDLKGHRHERRAALARTLVGEPRGSSAGGVAPEGNPDGFQVRVHDLPARTVAYIRVHDPFRAGAVQRASERLLAWAVERGLAGGQWLGYMWDEPETVALPDCRYDVALVVDAVQPAGEIGRFDFPPMRVAEIVVRGDLALEARAFDWLYDRWLPHSHCVPDDQPAFEAWIGRPYQHGDGYFELACQLPIKPG